MMIGKGTLRENYQTRSYLRKKGVRRGPARGNREKVIIDVDSDNLDDVIIIDVTESLQNKLCGSKVLRKNRKYPFPSVISIDDDDTNHMGDGTATEYSIERDDNAGSSKSPVSDHFMNSMCLDGEECNVINEKKSAFKFSKCGQTSSAKTSRRKIYGLGPNSEGDSSEHECSDCEVMEGSFEVLREQWEKASVKKKKRQLFNDQSAFDGKASASGSHSHMNSNVGIDRKKENSVDPGTSGSSDWHYQEKNMFSRSHIDDCQMDNPAYDVGKSSEASTQNVTGSGKQKLCVDNDRDYQPTCADLGSCQGPTCSYTLSSGKSVDGSNSSQVKLDLNSEEISLPDSFCNGTKNNCHETCLGEANEQSEVRDELCTKDNGASSSDQGDIINEREKLKESDEYKRAMEEEWASRHRQLLLQQEEAQRLRKRKKAESMRVLDMERRQKQRVEEVRETQKKDEENINLKEQVRAEIRKEMNKLESISINMVSLLRGLGIQVGGGVNPTSYEVHAAYRRALLKFHPDRASKTDIRQQVEAEEKFKLISRMKEKFLSTSCY